MDLLIKFDKSYKKIIDPYIDFGESIDEIKEKIKSNLI